VGVLERPNMPGTVDGWPNWQRPLPVSLEELMRSEEVSRLAEVVGQGRIPAGEPGSEARP
jgi:4-alpha-glucanotransferase